MKLDSFATLKCGDVIEVRIGKEIQIFTVSGPLFEGGTLVPVIGTDGKQASVYFRDVISKL